MPTLTFTTKYRKNTGILLTPTDLRNRYLYGINILAGDGTVFPDEGLLTFIQSAQQEIERYLSIKFDLQLVSDNGSYYRDDYMNGFPIIKTKFPVKEPLSLIGFYKKIEQIRYPISWLSSHESNDGVYKKRISIVPTVGTMSGTATGLVLSGTTFLMGSLRNNKNLPDYWHYQYVTGFEPEKMPMEMVDLVGKLASIGYLNVAGDFIIGAGIASQSLSIDGLSQSISTTSSATSSGYSARIGLYVKEIKETLKRVSAQYKGITFTTL